MTHNDDGKPGFIGQPGVDITSTASSVIISGPTVIDDPTSTIGAALGSSGGAGGQGGDGGSPAVFGRRGGDGGAGGRGGRVTLTLSGNIVRDDTNGLAGSAITARSNGGVGGNGGGTARGISNKTGGNGGAGGAAGSVHVAASGNATVVGDAVFVVAAGGRGGLGGSVSNIGTAASLRGGAGGAGGAGGEAATEWRGGAIDSLASGLKSFSIGGAGGGGGSAGPNGTDTGGRGGAGGSGGSASALLESTKVTIVQAITYPRSGAIYAASEGGGGGSGGQAGGASIGATAGSGGAGGAGGPAAATVLGSEISFTAAGLDPAQAILVESAGGAGGRGGDASALSGQSGGGGFAGAGGTATLELGNAGEPVEVTTTGRYGNVALVQSIGGGGGNGGGAPNFFTPGGAGAAGGGGGVVSASVSNGTFITTGASAGVLVAQSIGGGGGVGGDASNIAIGVGVAIGGNGGTGGNGGAVNVDLGTEALLVSRDPEGNGGVLAQSIGGSGGAGGSAVARGSGTFLLTVGGDGKAGGQAGAVNVTSGALISTAGDHANGIQAQSIGGGGGKGGSAFSLSIALLPTASVAVGGRGGSGGAANDATINNNGQVTTVGSDAFGVIAQSIGGGGGSGGASAARAVAIGLSDDIPSISIAVSTGGKGGDGNTGAKATLNNSGTVATQGEGATALVAQSVGGGGGAGGDSTAASFSAGQSSALAMSIAVAVGGGGGSGGTGGDASVTNRGLLVTLGGDAHGLLAQSVGGGGGIGGGGDAAATSGPTKKGGMTLSLAIGGTGGTGGTGGAASGVNAGGIATSGDGADGMLVQSVGGGGGIGGGGVAQANGPTLAVTVGVGGSGGAGGNGGKVTASNSGAIVTRGTDATGVFAQSVGGGGGKGGKGGATSGGVNPLSATQSLFNKLADGFGLGEKTTERINGVFELAEFPEKLLKSAEEIKKIAQQLKGTADELFKAENVHISVGVGGSGGAAGDGEAVAVANTGQIETFGAESDGIFAQSVGGGGGKGGEASATDKAADDFSNQAAIGVGGSGNAGGAGGSVSVANAADGSIVTHGVLAFGVFAQSVGGGGGQGAMAGVVSGSLRSLSIGVGGSGGANGNGGAVDVTAGDGTTSSHIDTTGKHAVALFAQSVGGGGGVARSMTTDETFDPALLVDNPQGRLFDVHGLALSFGGSEDEMGKGASGNGGIVNVTLAGDISTLGLGAHGILAQSIGGGGGMVSGGRVQVPGGGSGGNGGSSGNGGEVSVRLDKGSHIVTAGQGAYGILAQSIGGGGGVAGDLSTAAQIEEGTSFAVKRNSGNAAGVTVDLDGSSVETTGAFAPAIFAQSIGGGGGLVNADFVSGNQSESNIQMRGSAGGDGDGGVVTVLLKNSSAQASGDRASGIFAQSDGRRANTITVSIDRNSSVTGGSPPGAGSNDDLAAIRLQGGTQNQISNAGAVWGDHVSADGGTAIRAMGASTGTTIVNTGTIVGAIYLSTGANRLDNQAGGRISAINLDVNEFRNSGTFLPGAPGENGIAFLTGNYVQTATGTFVATGNTFAKQLRLTGSASLAGLIEYNPKTVGNKPILILSSSKGVTLDPTLKVSSNAGLVSFRATVVAANDVYLQPQAQFGAAATAFGGNRRNVAANLQTLFDSGASFDAGFTALVDAGMASYAKSLSALSGEGLGTIGAFRFEASTAFVQQMYSGCRAFDRVGAESDETSCVWSRIIGGRTTQDDTADATGYAATSVVFQLGGQREIADDWYVSGSLAYETSQFDDNRALTRVTGDSVLGGAYLRYHRGGLQVSGAVDGGYGWFDTTRSVIVGGIAGVAHGKAEEWHVGVHGRAAYEVAAGGGYLQPFVDFNAVYVHTQAFSERGLATFGLAVDGQGNTALAGGAGLELGGRIPLKGGGFARPFISAAYQLLNHSEWVTTAHFIDQTGSGASFREITPAPDRLGRFAAGLEIVAARDVDLSFQYTPNVGRGYVTHAGTARLSVRF